MDEKERLQRWRTRKREATAVAKTCEFPPMPCPENARFSVKQVAYLHAYLGHEPRDIAARYSKMTSLAEVHAALGRYFGEEKAAVDAEIARDRELNRRDSLAAGSRKLPGLSLASLVGVAEIDT